MRPCLATLLVLFALARQAGAGERPEPPGADLEEKLSGNVAVWLDAPLYAGRGASAPNLKMATLDGGRAHNLGQTIPFHVVKADGERVEVEPVADNDCGWVSLRVDPWLSRLRLFVRRADLAPVATKPFRASFDDGTSIEIDPGAPVTPDAAGGFVTTFSGDEVPVAIPASSVGHSYVAPPGRPAHEEPASRAEPAFFALRGCAATLGTRTVTIRDELLYPHVGLKPDRRGSEVLFPLTESCARAKVLAPSTAITSYRVPENLPGLTRGWGGAAISGWFLPKGTQLATAAGEVVAVAANDVHLQQPAKGERAACNDFSLYLEQVVPGTPVARRGGSRLTLCGSAEKAVRLELRDLGGASDGVRPRQERASPAAAGIVRIIRRHAQQIRSCFERRLATKAVLAGDVVVEVTVGADGRVTKSGASGLDSEAAACVAKLIEGMVFPKREDGQDVSVRYAIPPAAASK